MDLFTNVFLLILFIILSAFFSASEVSFLSLSLVRLHSLIEKNAPNISFVSRLRSERKSVIISILIWNNIVNIAASAIATDTCIILFGESGLAIAVGIMSFLLLTFGDIAPKSFATSNGEKFLLLFAPLLYFFYFVSLPLVVVFDALNRLIPGVYSRATIVEQFSEDEVRSAVKLGAMHKSITEKEKELIENVLKFDTRTVGEIMTPKSNVVHLPHDLTVSEAHKKALDSHYSRFPVIDSKGKVLGTLSVKILGKHYYQNPTKKLHEVVWDPIIVKSSEKVSDVFSSLQVLGRNIAIVVNDKNEFVGVVSLEDLLEEIVGELK